MDRKVKTAGFESVRLPEHLQRQVQQYRLLELDGLEFEDFFIRLVMLVLNNKKTDLAVRVASQMIWQVIQIAEDKLCSTSRYLGKDGVKRELQPVASDVSIAAADVQNIWNAENWRHTSRELWRYREASRTAMDNPLFVSLAGPDGTKVGTDLAIQMAAIMNPSTGIVCLAPPQVLNATLQPKIPTPKIKQNRYG